MDKSYRHFVICTIQISYYPQRVARDNVTKAHNLLYCVHV